MSFLLALNKFRPLFLCFYGWLWVCFCLPDSLISEMFYVRILSTRLKNAEEANWRCSKKKDVLKIYLMSGKNTSNGVIYFIMMQASLYKVIPFQVISFKFWENFLLNTCECLLLNILTVTLIIYQHHSKPFKKL